MFEGWAAAAAVVGSGIAGAAISSAGAQSAAQTQANAANNAQQISLQEFNTITGQEQPYMQSGYGALSNLDYLLGVTPQTSSGAPAAAAGTTPNNATGTPGAPGGALSGYANPYLSGGIGIGSVGIAGIGLGGSGVPMANTQPIGAANAPASAASTAAAVPGGSFGSLVTPFTTENWKQLSPAYNFNLQQGQQNVLNADAAGQGSLSGAALKDLSSFNQANANNSFNNAFNQYQTQQGNIFSRLSGIAQLGQASAANTGQQGTALSGQAAQSATNVGSALAAGQVGSANAWSGAISNAAPWLYSGGGSSLSSVPGVTGGSMFGDN